MSNAQKITGQPADVPADTGRKPAPPAPQPADQPDDGLVEVMLTGHYTTPDGVPHLPESTVRVTPDLASSLRFSGYAAREE